MSARLWNSTTRLEEPFGDNFLRAYREV